jgi:hypothetical protein
MLSSTPKRSFTTLAVIAGLLAAVAPAGAHYYPSGNALPTRVACDGIGALTCTSLKAGKNEVAVESRTAKARGAHRTHMIARSGQPDSYTFGATQTGGFIKQPAESARFPTK